MENLKISMIKMENKYKIVLNYIKDLTVEIPNPDALITTRNNISKYLMKIDITSSPTRNKMIEVITKLSYSDPSNNKKKSYFEMTYATVINIFDINIKKKELEKLIVCDLQIKIYPSLEKIFLDILHSACLHDVKFNKKFDFEKLYSERLN